MAGQFSPTSRPPRPGAYFNFEAQTPAPVLVNTLGIVALPITHNWGPANKVVPCQSFAEFLKYFGDGGASGASPVYTPGYKAVRQAFVGEGLPGRGGAGEVLVYRKAGTGALAATTSLQNTATTPAPGLVISAIYTGTFGANISVAVVANAQNPTTQADLQVYVSGFLTETFTYTKTAIAALQAQINDTRVGSKWIVASGAVDGTALATVSSPVALSGGNDGATLTGQDYTSMLAAFGVQRFGVFADQDIANTAAWTDSAGSAILTSILAWQTYLNKNGKRFTTVIGGSAADTPSAAAARSALINDPNVINVGIGTYNDIVLGALDTSQLAPRLAGIIAARTDRQGLSFTRLAGLQIVTGAQDIDIVQSLNAGFMVISRDSSSTAPVRFEKGLTTYVAPDAARPAWAYQNPKFVITMQSLENDLTQWAEENVIGQLPVDDTSVQFVIGNLKARLKALESDRVIQPGWTVMRNPTPAPSPQDDFVAVLYGISFLRDMEQVLNTVVVS